MYRIPIGRPGELPGDDSIKNSEVAYNMALEFAGQQNMEAAHHYIALAMKLQPGRQIFYTQALCTSPSPNTTTRSPTSSNPSSRAQERRKTGWPC